MCDDKIVRRRDAVFARAADSFQKTDLALFKRDVDRGRLGGAFAERNVGKF